MTKTLTVKNYLEERKEWVEERLKKYLPPETPDNVLTSAMRYAVLTPGKRIRPIVMIATAELLGAPLSRIYPAACAVEFLHTYTLVHDDLPSMDDDALRRGIPTVHKKFGEATAILAGDALQALAFEVLSKSAESSISPQSVLAVTTEIAEAVGWNGVVGGQQWDMMPPAGVDAAQIIREIHAKKTMALFRAAVRSAAIMSEADNIHMARLTRFAEHFGRIFQIRDDILDQETEAKERPLHALPAVVGAAATLKEFEREIGFCNESISPYGSAAESLRGLIDFLAEGVTS